MVIKLLNNYINLKLVICISDINLMNGKSIQEDSLANFNMRLADGTIHTFRNEDFRGSGLHSLEMFTKLHKRIVDRFSRAHGSNFVEIEKDIY